VLRPGHRITVLVIVIVVVMVLRLSGQSPVEALGFVLAAGAVATRIGSWLGGQPSAQHSPEGGWGV
jgi:hypothetical protein